MTEVNVCCILYTTFHFIFGFIYFYLCVYASLSIQHACVGTHRGQIPWIWVTGMSLLMWIWTQGLWKSSQHSWPLSHLPNPITWGYSRQCCPCCVSVRDGTRVLRFPQKTLYHWATPNPETRLSSQESWREYNGTDTLDPGQKRRKQSVSSTNLDTGRGTELPDSTTWPGG